jgi:hypothetical protein
VSSVAREVAGGIIGGLVGAGLMRLAIPRIEARKERIPRQSIAAGSSSVLKSATTYKFAVILFHGDGDSRVRLDITVNSTTTSIRGDEQAIELLAGESITVVAVNEDTANTRSSPTIEILSLTF